MKTWKIAIVLLALLLAACGGTDQDSGSKGNPQPSAATSAETGKATRKESDLPAVIIEASGGKKVEVRVEIADGHFEQMRGLMYRTALGRDRGMLFVYRSEQFLSFWMRNTSIPLSIAYIDSKGRITDILDMKPFDDEQPHYVSSGRVMYALEVNQGFFDERGVKVGDHAELPR